MTHQDLFEILKSNHLSLASCESLTGGLFASTFTDISGASEVFKGAIITYTNEIKEKLGVSKTTIETYGAISKECAREMVLNASEYFSSDITVSFTGNAGPTASEGKDVGLVYVGLIIKNNLYIYKLNLTGSREIIRKKTVDFAFRTIYEKVTAIHEQTM